MKKPDAVTIGLFSYGLAMTVYRFKAKDLEVVVADDGTAYPDARVRAALFIMPYVTDAEHVE